MVLKFRWELSAFSFCSLQSPHIFIVQWKGFTQQNLRKKTLRKQEQGRDTRNLWDQERKNNEIIAGIHEKDLQSFKLVRLILDREVQVSTKTTWRRIDNAN